MRQRTRTRGGEITGLELAALGLTGWTLTGGPERLVRQVTSGSGGGGWGGALDALALSQITPGGIIGYAILHAFHAPGY